MLIRIRKRTPLARYFVEFGAWDGRHLSNTFFLAECGFAGCMIEGDAAKYQDLVTTLIAFPEVQPVCRYVAVEGPDQLDEILTEVGVPRQLDILSIDIDGNDYWIWKGLQQFRPKIVIIEINYCVRPGVRAINPVDAPFEWGVSGTSITSIRELADSKGYSLVANVGCNAIFVDSTYLALFHQRPVSESQVFTFEGFSLSELSPRDKVRKVTEHLRRRVAKVRTRGRPPLGELRWH